MGAVAKSLLALVFAATHATGRASGVPDRYTRKSQSLTPYPTPGLRCSFVS